MVVVAAAGGGDGGRLWLGGGVGEKARVWVFGKGRNEVGNAQKKHNIYIDLVRSVQTPTRNRLNQAGPDRQVSPAPPATRPEPARFRKLGSVWPVSDGPGLYGQPYFQTLL